MLMETKMVLEQLFEDAKRNPELRKKLIETQNEEDPLESFCNISCAYGHNISVGELLLSVRKTVTINARAQMGVIHILMIPLTMNILTLSRGLNDTDWKSKMHRCG